MAHTLCSEVRRRLRIAPWICSSRESSFGNSYGMMDRILVISAVLLSRSFACNFEPSSFNDTGIVARITMPAALVLNEQTAHVIQAAFRHADYPDIKGEKSVQFLGKIVYGLTNIHINDLSIENTEVNFKEDDAIDITIWNVSASFNGTVSYGYVGAWLVKLNYLIDFEIEASIDLQINVKMTCEKERLAVDTSDCYLTFHKLTLHLQRDKDPGWLKQLFTDFISFTLKLVLKNQVCKEINFLAQLLADFFQDLAAFFVQDGDIRLDSSLASFPVIKANYIETYHKGFLLYKNYSGVFHDSLFIPSLLSESQMVYFWCSEHSISALALAAFLDKRLETTITGEDLKEMFESEEMRTHQDTVHEIFQGAPYNDSMAKVWSVDPPQITLEPEGTAVKSSVAVELSVPSQGGEPSVVLYFEMDITTTIQASAVQKQLVLHLSHATMQTRMLKCSPDIAVSNATLGHIVEKIVLVSGIPEVMSRIEQTITSLVNSKGLDQLEIKDLEIITQKGYLIIQLDFDFPHHLLIDYLKKTLQKNPEEESK